MDPRPCKHFRQGRCYWGRQCRFSHSYSRTSMHDRGGENSKLQAQHPVSPSPSTGQMQKSPYGTPGLAPAQFESWQGERLRSPAPTRPNSSHRSDPQQRLTTPYDPYDRRDPIVSPVPQQTRAQRRSRSSIHSPPSGTTRASSHEWNPYEGIYRKWNRMRAQKEQSLPLKSKSRGSRAKRKGVYIDRDSNWSANVIVEKRDVYGRMPSNSFKYYDGGRVATHGSLRNEVQASSSQAPACPPPVPSSSSSEYTPPSPKELAKGPEKSEKKPDEQAKRHGAYVFTVEDFKFIRE